MKKILRFLEFVFRSKRHEIFVAGTEIERIIRLMGNIHSHGCINMRKMSKLGFEPNLDLWCIEYYCTNKEWYGLVSTANIKRIFNCDSIPNGTKDVYTYD